MKWLDFIYVKGTLVVVDTFEDVMDVVVQYSHSVKAFFYGRRAVFIVVIKVNCARIKDIETSVRREFLSSRGCGIADKV